MKSSYLIGLLAAVAVAGIAEAAPQTAKVCEPNAYFRDYCNHCWCSPDGDTMACTLMACPEGMFHKNGTLRVNPENQVEVVVNRQKRQALEEEEEEEEEEVVEDEASISCTPGTNFMHYCNHCKCGSDGKVAVCTLMYCSPKVWFRNGTLRASHDDLRSLRIASADENNKKVSQEQEESLACEPGATFNSYCNTCWCSKDGSFAACTRMYCDPEIWNRDGTLKIEAQKEEEEEEENSVQRSVRSVEHGQVAEEKKEKICEPGKRFKRECNWCACSADGTFAACTRMYCDPEIWNSDGTLKIEAQEEEEEENSVKRLVRSVEQRQVAEEKKEKVCEPGKRFKRECNWCACSADGTFAACTKMMCPFGADFPARRAARDNWGPLYRQGDSCPAGQQFFSECNSCLCANDGKSAICTMMLCSQ